MRRLFARLLLMCVAGWLGACQQTAGPTFYLGGIQVNEPDHERWVRTLREAGLNTLSVAVYAHQGNWDSDHLWFDEEAESVLREVRTAKRAGLKVVLILRLALDHASERNRFLWHGMVMPRSDDDVRSWFRQYREFAEKWARIAEAEGIDVLGFASEMNALTSTAQVESLPVLEEYYLNPRKQEAYRQRVLGFAQRINPRHLRGAWGETYDDLHRYLDDRIAAHGAWAEQVGFGGDVGSINRRRQLLEGEWVALIETLRGLYSGPLTYAANFDQYEAVSFWDRLDFIGINAYFPLRRERSELEGEELYPILEDAWRGILTRVDEFRRGVGAADTPVLLTELGYTSSVDSTIEPWAADGFSLIGRWEDPELMIWNERARDFEERALAVRALRRAARSVDEDLVQGILYWKLSTQESHRQIEPFVLIVGSEPPDPLLVELLAFLQQAC